MPARHRHICCPDQAMPLARRVGAVSSLPSQVAHRTEIPVAGPAVHYALVPLDRLPTAVAFALVRRPGVQWVASGALHDVVAGRAEVIVARLAAGDHLLGLHGPAAAVAGAGHREAGQQRVAALALRQGRGLHDGFGAHLCHWTAGPTDVPVTPTAVHDHVPLQDWPPAAVAAPGALGAPALEGVATGASCDRVAASAEVPVALPAIHDEFALFHLPFTAVTNAE
mmetsp:Transcript_91499/g.259149  ORF Transcript_91499/g.259149 Transcript_91499/m.259149 type:complete len:225 (-) Transcript_91499:461-1135(-)